jgi:hypothetical protein
MQTFIEVTTVCKLLTGADVRGWFQVSTPLDEIVRIEVKLGTVFCIPASLFQFLNDWFQIHAIVIV